MKKVTFLSLIILFFFSSRVYPSHIMGADISYQCLGGNMYEFTLTVYRDCDGIPIQPTYNLDYSSLSCNKQGTILVSQVSMKDISPVCANESSSCEGGGQPGIQQYIFKGRLNLPAQCKDWVFSWTTCARTNEITNIKDPGIQCLHIEAKLNNILAPGNSSPSFKNPPVSFLCKGQNNFINPGTTEIDGDQLVFSTVTPKSGKSTTIQYLPPFNAQNPLSVSSPFSVNSQTGNIDIIPSNDSEISVTAILVEEKRNGQVIGSVMRDIILITRDCNNSNPVLSGINNSQSDSISVCAGNQVCFSIFGSDLDANQNLSMSWNQPWDTSVAKFTVTGSKKNPKANICWKTTLNDVGLHLFTVTVKDDYCPIFGTTTKAYKIRVNPNPKVVLPADMAISCTQTANIGPTVSLGKPPYIYKWNSGEVTPFVNKGQGTYILKVTDANGCFGTDDINISTGVIAKFTYDSVCISDANHFIDSSMSLAGTIVSWSWNFGDPASGINNTSNLQNPTHIFSTNKIFPVKLIVTDNFGCTGTITKNIKVCDIPQPDFSTMELCQNETANLQELTKVKNCGISQYQLTIGNVSKIYPWWSEDGKLDNKFHPPHFPTPNFYFDITPVDTGWVTATLVAINENGCKNSNSKLVHINPQPKNTILELDYYFNCSRPDTILHGVVLSAKEPYTIAWNTGETTNDIHINSPGVYAFTVTDAKGCSYTSSITVGDPLVPKFSASLFCEPTQSVQFLYNELTPWEIIMWGDKMSTLSNWGVAKWEYKFGDGDVFTTTNKAQSSPNHLYPVDSYTIYHPKLIVTDKSGCIDSTTIDIVHKFPDNNFKVFPTPICLGQSLNLQSPSGFNVDTMIWDFDNGVTRPLNQKKLTKSFNGMDTIYSYTGNYTYPNGAGNTYDVKLRMFYNDSTCYRDYSQAVKLFPRLKIAIDSSDGYCGDFPTKFYASQINDMGGGNTVTSWDWKFYFQQQTPPYAFNLVATSQEEDPVITFTENGNYYADLTAVNGDGCEEVITQYTFSIVKLPVPLPCPNQLCAEQQTIFLSFCSVWPEVVIDSIHWDFGDDSVSNVREPFHIYDKAGTYDVKVEIFNTTFGCKAEADTTITMNPLPIPDFEVKDICLGQTAHFIDLSIDAAPNDPIISWHWLFGDGTESIERNPSHFFADTGTYKVGLVVQSEKSGCADTIFKNVHVFPNPEAGFTTIENELVTERPVTFIDQSSGAVKWLWYFGDKDSLVVTDPLNINTHNVQHTYHAPNYKVLVEQIVYNKYGCTDTAQLKVNLIVYFDLPSGFSPNGDNNNDGFYPIYKGIDKLIEFRVYDRWGQLIFDGSGNLQSVWDGKYKGAEQPVGVYVYYARALGFDNKEYMKSGNVTLIR